MEASLVNKAPPPPCPTSIFWGNSCSQGPGEMFLDISAGRGPAWPWAQASWGDRAQGGRCCSFLGQAPARPGVCTSLEIPLTFLLIVALDL